MPRESGFCDHAFLAIPNKHKVYRTHIAAWNYLHGACLRSSFLAYIPHHSNATTDNL